MPSVYTTPTLQQFWPRNDADLEAEQPEIERALEMMAKVHAGWLRQQEAPAAPVRAADLDTPHPSRTSLFYVAAITFVGPQGERLEGYGAAIGLASDAPTLTVFLSRGPTPIIMATPQTRPWIDLYGRGELPDPGEAPPSVG